MSRKHQSINNKNPKVYFKQYLDNINEPADYMFGGDLPPEQLTGLLNGSFSMKRRVRHLAKKMRKNHNNFKGLV
jgi:hypothetical protein